MRQRSIALQQAVVQSRLASAVAKSRFASASRRWGTKLQPLVNPKVHPWTCTCAAAGGSWILAQLLVLAQGQCMYIDTSTGPSRHEARKRQSAVWPWL
jgi:hypothetical protein